MAGTKKIFLRGIVGKGKFAFVKEEASQAYDTAAVKIFGDYARLNAQMSIPT